MSTAKKIKEDNILVSYTFSSGKYTIMTNNEHAVALYRKSKIELRFENHSYHITVDELPMIAGIEYRQYKLKPYTSKQQSELETEVQKLKDMEEAVQKMMETIEAQEKLVTKMVMKNGLKLKPHLPKDSEMFSPKHKERVHYKISCQKIVDQEVVRDLLKKHPQLGKCFKKDVRTIFVRSEFDKIQKTLPAEAINKIVTYNEVASLAYYSLENFECTQCGGMYSKKGICKHCGQSKGA